MAKRTKYVLGGREYPTKESVKKYCREILHGLNFNETVEDFDFLYDLVQHHNDVAEKVGCGITRFYVGADSFNGRCFWLERTDGTTTDVSFIQCLASEKARGADADLRAACRDAIGFHRTGFRETFFRTHADADGKIACPDTGELCSKDETHVDHKKPNTFHAIYQQFLTTYGIDPATVAVQSKGDGLIVNQLIDEEFRAKWVAFHNERAEYEVVSKTANLSLRRRGK